MKRHLLILALSIPLFSLHRPIASEPEPNEVPGPPVPEPPMVASNPAAVADFETVRLRWGATLEALLLQKGTPRETITGVIAELRRFVNPRRLRAGDRLELLQDDHGAVLQLRYRPQPHLLVTVARDSQGRYSARCDTLARHREPHLLVGRIESTLYDAVLAAGESSDLIVAFSDIFQWDIDFFIDPRRGDRFRILFEKIYLQDPDTRRWEFTGYGDILAAAYEKADTVLVAFAYQDSTGRLRYYDSQGRSFQKTFLKSPLNYRRITSYFSNGRRHPILRKVRAHTGVDFAAPVGTPVVAAADGRIVHLGWLGGYGRCIKISHKNGSYMTLYGHLSGYARGLHVGAAVAQGQVIGYVGKSGLATGPHLHYTMYYNGRPIDPLKIRVASGSPLDVRAMPAFQRRARELAFKLGLQVEPAYAGQFPKEGFAR